MLLLVAYLVSANCCLGPMKGAALTVLHLQRDRCQLAAAAAATAAKSEVILRTQTARMRKRVGS